MGIISQLRVSNLIAIASIIAISLGFLFWVKILTVFGVDVPFLDQWDTPAIQLVAAYHDSLDMRLLAGQHNDSRKLFPNLISLTLFRVTGSYNPAYELFIGLFIGAVITAGLGLLAFRMHRNMAVAASLAGLYAGLFLAARTSEFHFQSLTFERLIPQLCLVLVLLRWQRRRLCRIDISLAALASFIAHFSYSGGIILWPLLGLYIAFLGPLSRPARLRFLAFWICLAGLSFWLFFIDFKIPSGFRATVQIDDIAVAQIFRFFISFIGNSVSSSPDWAVLFGGLTSLFFCALTLRYMWRLRLAGRQLGQPDLTFGPWIILGGYSIATGAAVTIGRLPAGFQHVFRGDYVTYGNFLIIATAALFIAGLPRVLKPVVTIAYFGAAVALLSSLTTNHFQDMVRHHKQHFSYAKACLILAKHFRDEKCLDRLFPPRRDRFQKFERASPILKPGLLKALTVRGVKRGSVDRIQLSAGHLSAHGWAVTGTQPAAVVAIATGPYDRPKIMALLPVTAYRPDLKDHPFGKIMWAGWKAEIRLSEKIHRCDLYFYAVDTEKGTLMPLNDIHRPC